MRSAFPFLFSLFVTLSAQDARIGERRGAKTRHSRFFVLEYWEAAVDVPYGTRLLLNRDFAIDLSRPVGRIFLPVLTGSDCASTIYLFLPCLM